MTDRIETLRAVAMAADEGYSGAHPRDSNNWKANEAFCRAFNPKTALVILSAVQAAKNVLRLRDERVHITLTETSAATRASELYDNGRAIDDAWAALRAALEELEKMK